MHPSHWSICAQVGRTIQGKPYLVRRLSNGALATTSTECGRCEYPLLQAEQKTFEDSEFICCDMCGATFDVEDGAPQPSAEGAGKMGRHTMGVRPGCSRAGRTNTCGSHNYVQRPQASNSSVANASEADTV